MTRGERSHTCGELRKEDVGKKVALSGWVHVHRDLGSLIFIDLRDRFGLCQLVLDEKHPVAKEIRSEWVIHVRGTVALRKDKNPHLPTGEIEIIVDSIEVLSKALTPPFPISEEEAGSETLRLKYRFLDLRREFLTKALVMRHKVMLQVRSFLDENGFLEVQTPILGKPTTETGARDYLVPSRIHPGTFYALPQSPQIYKQLLMVAGFDRYFQIAPCFRDEDLRADRQPEFTQIDMELSFANQKMLMDLIEKMLQHLFKNCIGVEVKLPFTQMAYDVCMEKYGSDKPDLRFGLPLATDFVAKKTAFEDFKNASLVKFLKVPKGAALSRRDIDSYAEIAQKFGLKSLPWFKYTEGKVQGGVSKYFEGVSLDAYALEEGDLLFFGAGSEKAVNQALDNVRRALGRNLGLIDEKAHAFLWVTDFPLFSMNAETGSIQSEHHPFTSAKESDWEKIGKDPLAMRAASYDIVLNGYELGGGSVRIHDADKQQEVFRTLQISDEEIKKRFGFFVDALKYGTPPHLGIAIGLDRLVMLLIGTDNLRDVIAFPKTTQASDLMMECPSNVADGQLNELHLKVKP